MQDIQQFDIKINEPFNKIIRVMQGDVLSRYIRFNFKNADGTAMDLTGHTVRIDGTKKDGTVIFNDLVIEDATLGITKCELTSQALAVDGKLTAQLKIMGNDGSILKTKIITILVDKAMNNEGAIESSNEFTALDNALVDVNTIKTDVSTLKTDNTQNKDYISTLKTDNAQNKADIQGLGASLADKENLSTSAYNVVQKLYYNYENVNIVVLGDSTGNETTEWVYLLAQKLGVLYPAYTVKYHLWDDVNYVYGAPTTVQTGTGANTLNIYNASVAGKNLYYPIQHNFKAQVVTPNPNLVIISHGHNEGTLSSDLEKWNNRARYYLLTQYVSNSVPGVSIMLIAQNPQTASDVQKMRVPMIAEIASTCGYGFVNVHDAFLQISNWNTNLMLDTVHPNANGQNVWIDEVMKQFRYSPGLKPIIQSPSSFGVPIKNLLVNGDFKNFAGAIPDNWLTIGTLTASKDLTNFETKGYGVKFVTGAGAQGSIYQNVIGEHPLSFYKGKYLTLAVRMRKPTGQPVTTGRVALYDGVNTFTSVRIYAGNGDFYWDCATLKVSDNATALRAYIYADSATTGNMEVTIDRAILTFGVLPRDIV